MESDKEAVSDMETDNVNVSTTERKMDENENSIENDDAVPQPALRLTNFSIDEILKPGFGVRTVTFKSSSTSSAFSPVRNHGVLDLTARKGPSSSSSSPRVSPKRTTPLPTPTAGSPGTEARAGNLWPAWVYCTRYSDRPSSGPRSRKIKKKDKESEEKRPRTAFSNDQLQRLKKEFEASRYLSEQRRRDLARELNLTEAQIKIWFQNKRAKIKKSNGLKHPLALHLMAQGLYNHATVTIKEEEDGHSS